MCKAIETEKFKTNLVLRLEHKENKKDGMD